MVAFSNNEVKQFIKRELLETHVLQTLDLLEVWNSSPLEQTYAKVLKAMACKVGIIESDSASNVLMEVLKADGQE